MCVCVCLLLSFGHLLPLPTARDRKRIKELFPDSTSWNFDAFGLNDVPSLAVLLFRQGGKDTFTSETFITANINTDQEENNIFKPTPLKQIQNILKKVKAVTVEVRSSRQTRINMFK